MKLSCACCRKTFDREWLDRKNNNVFCSQSCAAKYNNTRRKKKKRPNCQNCGKEVGPKSTKYCCNRCQQEYQSNLILDLWRAGKYNRPEANGTVRRPIRKYLIDKAGNKCTICGWDKKHPTTGKVPLEVHHIDGDYTNNIEENLQVLCPNCHSLTPSYRSLNKRGGREFRRKK